MLRECLLASLSLLLLFHLSLLLLFFVSSVEFLDFSLVFGFILELFLLGSLLLYQDTLLAFVHLRDQDLPVVLCVIVSDKLVTSSDVEPDKLGLVICLPIGGQLGNDFIVLLKLKLLHLLFLK